MFKKIVVAVPVISYSATERIQKENIELVTLEIPDYFTGVGAFYENFKEVNDEEIDGILKMNKKILSEKTKY